MEGLFDAGIADRAGVKVDEVSPFYRKEEALVGFRNSK